MTYCSVSELAELTGSQIDDDILEAIIEQADRQIDARLAENNLSGGGNTIKAASLSLSIAGLLTRYRFDGTKPQAFTVSKFSMSDNVDEIIKHHTKQAWDLVASYVRQNTPGGAIQTKIRIANSR